MAPPGEHHQGDEEEEEEVPLGTLVENLLEEDGECQGQDHSVEDEPGQEQDSPVLTEALQGQQVGAQRQGGEEQNGDA